MKTILILLGLCVLFSLVQSEEVITVFTPESLSKKLGKIHFQMGNFGHIPWGQNVIGPVYVPNKSEIYGCQEFEPVESLNFLYEMSPIFLVERGGNCTFVQKAINAQKAGAQALIIFDSQFENISRIRLGDDGNGGKVKIPVIFIDEQAGLDIVSGSQNLPENLHNVVIQINFEMMKSSVVTAGFYIALPDERSLTIVNNFADYFKQGIHSKQFQFHPVYQFFSLYNNGHNYEKEQSDCLGGGRYCCIDPDGAAGSATGRHIAEEQLRQLCVYKAKGQAAWFDYMKKFEQKECVVQAYKTCSNKILKELDEQYEKIKTGVNKCVSEGFEGQSKTISKHSLLEEQLEILNNSGTVSWPGVHINNINYAGKLSAYAIAETVCNAALDPDSHCLKIGQAQGERVTNFEENSTLGIILIITLVLIVLFVIIGFFYKRYLRKTIKRDMRGQINQVVSNYVKFYEARQSEEA